VGAPEGAAPAAAPATGATWKAPAAVLYDNGPQVTHPGGGAGGADASAVQTALGNSTFGFGHAVTSGFRMADDFTVPAGGWTIDQITFFAYQTGSTTTSTINAVNLRIWDGPPNDPGSMVVFGDTTTNRLTSSIFSNIYRVTDTTLTNNQRPVMADVAAVGVFLPAGTYWVDWQTGGTLTSGPWAPPVTILGQTGKPGANGLQYNPTTSTWDPAIDTGANAPQDLPFIVEGTAGGSGGPCSAPSDIPWLSLSATAGSNTGGTNTDVTVTFDSTGLAVGTYTGNLCVTSNDPDAGPGNGTDLVVVPVELIVEEGQPGAFVCNAPAEGFENGVPPAGWSIQTNEPNGPQWSTIAGCGETGNFTNGSGEAACVSSDIFGAAEMDTSLVTPMFDLTGFGTASLSYTANYQNFANLDFLNVDISADGGATWTTLLSWNEDHGAFRAQPGENVSIDLSAYAGQSGLMLRYRYYDPNTGDWNWYAQVDNVGLTCGQVGPEPNIDVDPLSMSSTQATNTTTQQTLDVGNTGTADLTWMIEEEPAQVVEAPAAPNAGPAKLDAPAAVQRSAKELQDLLNSRAVDVVQDGSFEAGTPNPFWTEFSTNFGTPLCDAGCGFGGGTGPRTGAWWAWFGGIAAFEAGSLMQSVTIPAGGPATLTFYVEQPVCSGAAADYLEVRMDGVLLWDTTGAAPECGVIGYRQVTVDVSAFANGGSHMVEFNSEIFGSDTTNFFVDDVVLDAQGGGGQVCSAPSDVPWLSVSPINGTTAPAAVTPVDVTFDSTGLAAGVYNANLCVESNDPDPGPGNETELVIVPVELVVTEPQNAAIVITKTVGLVDGVCATTSSIEVAAGTTVYYCYTVTNTGDVTLNYHDLADDQLGAIFTGLNYALTPGASVNTVAAGLSIPAVINTSTTNVATWTAYQSPTGGLSATATATATVNVASIEIVKTVGTDPAVCAAESNITVPAGTEVYYCYTVTNTGDVTLNLHDLVDDQLGTLFTGFAYALTPGSSVSTVDAGLVISAIANAPVLNTATWTAYNTGGATVTAEASAFVDVIYFSCENPEEDFESAPLGWSVVSSVAGGPEWGDIASCGPNGNGGNWTNGLGDAACISASTLEPGAYDAELRTPVFSLAGYNNATISFLVNYQNWAGIDELTFDISTDGGATWAPLRIYTTDQGVFQSTPGVYVTTDLAAYLGQSNLMLRWRYVWNDAQALGWYAQVDEAEFKCIEIPPTAVTLGGLEAVAEPAAVAWPWWLVATALLAAALAGAALVWLRRSAAA
jgi:hypothetical protein